MYPARSEARKPITAATSSGRSMRPSGTALSRCRVNSSDDMPSSAPCSRATDVHMSVSTNPGHTQFTRTPSAACAIARLLVMLMTAALLAFVWQIGSAPDFAGHRCQTDDDAAFLRDHGRQNGLTGKEDALGVDVHHRVPVFLGDLERLRGAIDAGIVDENVDSSEFGARPLDHGAEIPAGRDVGWNCKRATIEAAHFGCGSLSVSPIQLSHDDVRAHARQFERGRAADAAACASHYRDLALQLHMILPRAPSGWNKQQADFRRAPRYALGKFGWQ